MLAGCGIAVAVVALSACTPLKATMADAAAQGRSAVETSRLLLVVDENGGSGFSVTATAFADALRELNNAVRTVSEADAGSDTESDLRRDTLDALRAAVDAVEDARGTVHGIGDPDEVVDALEQAGDRLDGLAEAGGAG